jgi:hypothetical protein
VRQIAVIGILGVALIATAVEPALAAPKPKPRLGRAVVVKPAGGSVVVTPRGGHRFKLRRATTIPVGSTVDTTHGKVKLISARSARRTQSGTFSKGAFVVTQRRSDGLTDLKLTGGDFSVCTAARRARKPLAAAANRRRSLFGNAHGRFRTRGRNSSATVRGTTWLTEDRCDGTATENMSANPESKIDTKSHELEFALDPGQTITYYCNKFEIAPDTYCLVLLAQPADGIIGAGIITQVDVPDYVLCVHRPDGAEGCSQFPLTEKAEDGFRESVVVCPVGGPGEYFVGWSLDHENLLYPTLSLELDVAGPAVDCDSDPPVPPT